MGDLFPAGTETGMDTEAAPSIWEDRAGFDAAIATWQEAIDGAIAASPASGEELERLRSLYESYRLDQVSHLICLVAPEDFDEAVDTILEGRSIDFRARDRVQFARMVVDHIEALLPLPDFETWAEDFVEPPEAYRLNTHTLHRERRLP